jgi:hypothetical protein
VNWTGVLRESVAESNNGLVAVAHEVYKWLGRLPSRAEASAARRAAYTLERQGGHVTGRVHVRGAPGGVWLLLADRERGQAVLAAMGAKPSGERGPYPGSVRSIAEQLGISKSTVARVALEPDEQD